MDGELFPGEISLAGSSLFHVMAILLRGQGPVDAPGRVMPCSGTVFLPQDREGDSGMTLISSLAMRGMVE